ncbi:MAG: NADH-quinone oxidoreductase subunit NuoK [Nitrospinota bacterium]|nr:NADH-quinone oxidoreductase subunit NuoK [Nitrospinota bacterium]
MEAVASLNHYLILSAVLFSIGVIGVVTRRNAIVIYMSIEVMLNAVNLTFIAFSNHLNDMGGQVFTFMVMAVAAAEAAVGLAIIIALFRNKNTVDVDEVNLLKG